VRVYHTVPDDQPLVSLSINRGVPLVMSHSRSAVARAIQALALRFVADSKTDAKAAGVAVAVKPQSRNSLFQRVFHRPSSADA
jgi:pilus assembly protein CpaE